jgi:hypothetical protein
LETVSGKRRGGAASWLIWPDFRLDHTERLHRSFFFLSIDEVALEAFFPIHVSLLYEMPLHG